MRNLPIFWLALFAVGCGARTGPNLDVPITDAATESCSVPPLCSDNTRGTWRLETATHEPAGYLFTFDGSVSCNGTSHAFLLVLAASSGDCSRNGDYEIQDDTPSAFGFSADNLGGSFDDACGGDPGSDTLHLELTRSSCDPTTYTLVVQGKKTNSPYHVAVVAKRCRCDIPWQPCLAPLPENPCAP